MIPFWSPFAAFAGFLVGIIVGGTAVGTFALYLQRRRAGSGGRQS